MPIEVKLPDVIDALESAMEEHAYYLDKRRCEIILITAMIPRRWKRRRQSPTIPSGSANRS